MIPEQRGKQYAPFLSCKDLETNTIVTIQTEFTPPETDKIKSFLIGEVEHEGESYTLGINPSTYRNLSKTLGSDTAGWIDKEIRFLGLVQLGQGKGYLWTAEIE